MKTESLKVGINGEVSQVYVASYEIGLYVCVCMCVLELNWIGQSHRAPTSSENMLFSFFQAKITKTVWKEDCLCYIELGVVLVTSRCVLSLCGLDIILKIYTTDGCPIQCCCIQEED